MRSKPLVSVVISTFERPELLERAIESVMAQTYENIEVIVSDDCSKDNTQKVVEKLSEHSKFPLVYRCNRVNSGACHTRNEGILLASGTFIAGLDDDDEFTPDRIEKLMSFFDEKYSFVTSNTSVVSRTGRTRMFNSDNNHTISISDQLWENVVGTQVLVLRDRLLALNGFDVNLSSAQDADMWLRLIRDFGPALRISDSTYVLHTEHESPRISTSVNKLSGLKDYFEKHKILMSESQVRYFNLKYDYWNNNKKIKIGYIKHISLGVLIHIIKKVFSKA